MKLNSILFTFLLLIGFVCYSPIKAQSTFGCDLFCVTQVTLNTTEELWYVDIAFEGGMSDFINYPYVSSMVNTSGEIVAIGSMEYFGQIGGTSQIYHPALNVNDPNFEGVVYFVYDQDTCALYFPCLTNNVMNASEKPIAVIQSDDRLIWNAAKPFYQLLLFNSAGMEVADRRNSLSLEVGHLPSGLYIYQGLSPDGLQKGRVWIH